MQRSWGRKGQQQEVGGVLKGNDIKGIRAAEVEEAKQRRIHVFMHGGLGRALEING